jgi:DNA polymerase-3 subunit gamma/tau
LIDSFRTLPPVEYRYKIYIIDEVHMLSTAAFNALLKSLEEPPANTVFILATTELHKIPDTVASRCQRHEFRALPTAMIHGILKGIAQSEGLRIDDEALMLLARAAGGSVRDSQSLLDRVQTFCTDVIGAAEVGQALGTVGKKTLLDLSAAIFARDAAAAFDLLNRALHSGADPAVLARDFVSHWRDIFLSAVVGERWISEGGISREDFVEMARQTGGCELADVQDLYRLAREGADEAVRGSNPSYGLEALIVRMALRRPARMVADEVKQLRGAGSNSAAPSRVTSAVASSPKDRANVAAGRENHLSGGVQVRGDESRENAHSGPEKSGLNWGRFTASFGVSMLGEQLKRLRVVRFDAGVLEASGATFDVTSILRAKDKLQEKLDSFVRSETGQPGSVVIKLTVAAAGDNRGDASATDRDSPNESIEAHPIIQSLQKQFPGSKVERVRPR